MITMSDTAFEIDYLKRLGLHHNEAKVILALQTYGTMATTELSARSGVERTGLYRLLPGLEQRNLLVTQNDSKRTLVSPVPTNILLKQIDYKQMQLQRLRSERALFLDKLRLNSGKSQKQVVKFHSGREALKQIRWDNLLQKRPIYSYFSHAVEGIFGEKFISVWSRELQRAKLNNYVITHTKHPEVFQFPNMVFYSSSVVSVDMDIFENSVVYYSQFEDTVSAVEIVNAAVADHQRELFTLLRRELSPLSK